MTMTMTTTNNHLDEAQRRAVYCKDKNILCVAPPGSGKTRVLVARVGRLVEEGVDPSKIAVVTFTNAGAKEIQKRLGELTCPSCGGTGIEKHDGPTPETVTCLDCLGKKPRLGHVGTLHSFCLKTLNNHNARTGVMQVSVLSEDDSVAVLESVRAEMMVKVSGKELKKWVDEMRAGLSVFKLKYGDNLTKPQLVASEYLSRMRHSGELDFDAVLWWALELIQKYPTVTQYEHLLVDEYQDSALIDAAIYRAMVNVPNKFFVGDPDQNIYAFRGTTIQNTLALAGDPAVTKTPLSTNYRSAMWIVRQTQKLINHNLARVPQTVGFRPNIPAGSVEFIAFDTAAEELAWLVLTLANTKAEGTTSALLFRTNFLADQARDHLRALGVEVAEPILKLTDKDLVAVKLGKVLLALLANPHSEQSVYNFLVINHGPAVAAACRSDADRQMCSTGTVAVERGLLPRDGMGGVWLDHGDFAHSVGDLFKVPSNTVGWLDILASTVPSPFTVGDLLLAANGPDDQPQEFSSGVHVGTVHSAKGREWDEVYICDAEAEAYPGRDGEEEARRLFYVACTRAKNRLVVAHVDQRAKQFANWQSEPRRVSPFVQELEARS